MNHQTTSRLILFLLSIFLSSCTGPKTAVKQEAFDKGKVEISTVGKPEPHKSEIIIAVLPFRNNSPDKSLDSTGATLSDLISAQMSSKAGFKIVERQRIQEILSELKLGQTGALDQNTAVQVGKMLGANVMIMGSFSTLGKKVVLSMRLVKVETGEIVGGVSERGEDISSLDTIADSAARKLSDAISFKK